MASRTVKCFILLAALLAIPAVARAQQPESTSGPGLVVVEWTTESEVDLAGFNIYRAGSPDGPYVKINDALIPASPDPLTGGSYSYADSTAETGVTYYYMLEDVELDGQATTHGPVQVVARGQGISVGLQALPGAALLAVIALGVVVVIIRRRRQVLAGRVGGDVRQEGES
jgi:hypothetical protein